MLQTTFPSSRPIEEDIEYYASRIYMPEAFYPGLITKLIEHKKLSTPLLLAILTETLEMYEGTDDFEYIPDERCDYLIALYILSYFREPKAFALVIRFAQLAPEWNEKLLGDYVTESLVRWLISTYSGDLQAIKNVIENERLSKYARNAALKSLLGLFAENLLTRSEIIDYFQELARSDLVNNHEFATKLVMRATDLYPEELYQDIMDLFDKDLIEQFFINKEAVDYMLSLGKEECLNSRIYNQEYLKPITKVLSHVSTIHLHDNSVKLPGRNEHCYCGSYIKFKKCCYPLLNPQD